MPATPNEKIKHSFTAQEWNNLEIGNSDNVDLKTFKNYLHSSFVH